MPVLKKKNSYEDRTNTYFILLLSVAPWSADMGGAFQSRLRDCTSYIIAVQGQDALAPLKAHEKHPGTPLSEHGQRGYEL